MAYMSQQRKAELAPNIKRVLKKYNVKGSIAVRHHSTLVVNVRSGKINFIEDAIRMMENDSTRYRHMTDKEIVDYTARMRKDRYLQINPYWLESYHSGKALSFLEELKSAMMEGNHDRSNPQIDYFDVGWYIDINIGSWNKPYELVK